MNTSQLAWLEPHIEGFPKRAFAAAVKRNDVHAAEFIRQRRKLHPYWVYKIAPGEIPTMEMYKYLRNWGFTVLSPALYWCDREHIHVLPEACNDDIALVAARPDACTLDVCPHVMIRIRLLNCTFTREDVAKARHTMWDGLQADRAVDLGIATMLNVYNLSTAAAIVLSEKYNIPIETWIQILRWDDEAYAWMDTKRHYIINNYAYPRNERALRWLAMHPSPNVHGELTIRYSSATSYNGTISVKTKNWLCETREGAARLREVIDMVAQNTWTSANVLAACRYVDPVTWRKLYKHGIKRKHLVGALYHGNLDLLAYMHTNALKLFGDAAYLLAHMRHARTWRWLIAHGYTTHPGQRIHLDLDPKPCLIVAFHRTSTKYTYAAKSNWIKNLVATLPPI